MQYTLAGIYQLLVDHTQKHGVDRKAVYLCSSNVIDYKITWVRGANVKSFQVEFVGDDDDLPFGPNHKTFDNDHPTTPKLPDRGAITVFKYKITIVDINGVSHGPFDPHVVGGGGLAQYLSADLK